MTNIITISGKLEVRFIKGRNGQFPIGKILSNIGIFECRDAWLESLDDGVYEGEFDVSKITPYSYVSSGAAHTSIRAYVDDYRLEGMEESSSFYEDIPDPLEEESIDEPMDTSEETETFALSSEAQQEEPSFAKAEDDETAIFVTFINEQRRLAGFNDWWMLGDPLVIPSECSREYQRKIREFIKSKGYELADPFDRIWELAEVNHD